jgi:hypothetical protein
MTRPSAFRRTVVSTEPVAWLPRACVDPGRFAFARSADTERHVRTKSLALRLQPLRNLRNRIRPADIDDKKGLAVGVGPFLGALRSSGDCEAIAISDDEYCVAVAHVPFRTLPGLRGWCFCQLGIFVQETRRVRKVLGPTALWAPAAPGHATLNRDIKRCAIDAGLAAADDFHAYHYRTDPPPYPQRGRVNRFFLPRLRGRVGSGLNRCATQPGLRPLSRL